MCGVPGETGVFQSGCSACIVDTAAVGGDVAGKNTGAGDVQSSFVIVKAAAVFRSIIIGNAAVCDGQSSFVV